MHDSGMTYIFDARIKDYHMYLESAFDTVADEPGRSTCPVNLEACMTENYLRIVARMGLCVYLEAAQPRREDNERSPRSRRCPAPASPRVYMVPTHALFATPTVLARILVSYLVVENIAAPMVKAKAVRSVSIL